MEINMDKDQPTPTTDDRAAEIDALIKARIRALKPRVVVGYIDVNAQRRNELFALRDQLKAAGLI